MKKLLYCFIALTSTIYIQAQTKDLACFFLSSPGLIRNDQDKIMDHYKTFDREPLTNFEQSFMSDAVLHSFIKALCLKEKHIFISYATWENYQLFADLITKRLREIGITNPEQQLYVPKHKNKGAIFYGPQQSQNKKRFKQSLRNLPDKWAQFVIPLFMFDPQDWHIYDTQHGLYYLTPQENFNTSTCPVNIASMHKLASFDYAQNKKRQTNSSYIFTVKNPITGQYSDIDYSWTEKINTLLKTPTQWNLFFIGHGFPHNNTFESNILGMPARGGKLLLNHLNNTCKPRGVYMSSCYWFPERVLALLNGRHDNKIQKSDSAFNFEFVTAAGGNYRALEYDSEVCLSRYRPACFGKKIEFALLHKDTSTYELARKTAQADTQNLKLEINKQIKEFKSIHPNINPMLIQLA